MYVKTVALSDLLPGDIIGTGILSLTVRGKQVIGPFVIVDFTDDTSTAPIPNGLVEVRRESYREWRNRQGMA